MISPKIQQAEKAVLAALADPKTREAAAEIVRELRLGYEHFSDQKRADDFMSYQMHGVEYLQHMDYGKPPRDIRAAVELIMSEAERRAKPTPDEVVSEPKDAATWLDEPDEPDDPLIAELIERGSLIAIVGPAKAAKSWLALILCVCIATGRDFYGRATKRQRVYYANVEVSAKQAKKRLRAICQGLNVDAAELAGWLFVDNLRGTVATWNKCYVAAWAVCAEVVIIDPFYQVFKGEERDEAACLAAVEEMKKFLADGLTLFVVFHAPKGYSGDRQIVDMISGSSILVRFPENVIAILPHATEKDARVIDCSVLRDYAAPDPFCVRFENGTLALASDLQPLLKGARTPKKEKSGEQKAAENAKRNEAFKDAALEIANAPGMIGKTEFLEKIGETAAGAIGIHERREKLKGLTDAGTLVAVEELERKPNGGIGKKRHGKTYITTPARAKEYLDSFAELPL